MTLMNPKQSKRLSHTMSAILRHRAGQLGLTMDPAGWMQIGDLCTHMRVARAAIDEVVRSNNKTRFQVDGARIRASQGHSLQGMPVTQDALEASWDRFLGDESIWHGTRLDVVASIARTGIARSQRTHVHLADSTGSRVGKRAQVAVLLEVCPSRVRTAGYDIFRSPNGVILTRHVPPSCVVDVRPVSRRSHNQHVQLRAAFGLSP